jgi:hypothetical protein
MWRYRITAMVAAVRSGRSPSSSRCSANSACRRLHRPVQLKSQAFPPLFAWYPRQHPAGANSCAICESRAATAAGAGTVIEGDRTVPHITAPQPQPWHRLASSDGGLPMVKLATGYSAQAINEARMRCIREDTAVRSSEDWWCGALL